MQELLFKYYCNYNIYFIIVESISINLFKAVNLYKIMPQFLEKVVLERKRKKITKYKGILESGEEVDLSRPVQDTLLIDKVVDGISPVRIENPFVYKVVRHELLKKFNSNDFYVKIRKISIMPGVVKIDDKHEEEYTSVHVSYDVYMRR